MTEFTREKSRSLHYRRGLHLLKASTSAIALALPMSFVASAQTDDAEDSFTLEEIVVTAQKRAESLQDVPISVSALNSEALATTGFDSLSDLSRLGPSLQLSNFGPIAFVTVRGIGNENTTAGGDPSVALHFDGVYIGRPVGVLFSAFDTERVEVLRGPQGTLYGRNATGGSINYISKKPTQDTTFEGDLTYGDYDRKRVRLAANTPLNDETAVRVVGFWEDRDGFTENTFEGVAVMLTMLKTGACVVICRMTTATILGLCSRQAILKVVVLVANQN